MKNSWKYDTYLYTKYHIYIYILKNESQIDNLYK